MFHAANQGGGENANAFFWQFFASQGCGPLLHLFASVLPSVFLFSGKPWTDVYHVVLQMMMLLTLTIPLS